jgi:hypothetical protein
VAIALRGVQDAALVVFFPSGLEPAEAAAQATLAAGAVPVVGMTSNGAIEVGGPIDEGCSALAFDRGAVDVGIGLGRDASRDPQAAARRAVASALVDAPEGKAAGVVLLMIDTRSGDQALAVAGAYAEAGPWLPLAGGAAGGPEPAQFAPEGVGGCGALTDSVVAVVLRSDRAVGVGISHGAEACAVPAIVTSAQGRTVLELDGRPASDVYLEKLGFGGMNLDDRAFEKVAVTHPLAQPELSGDVRLRHVLGRSDGGGLSCATHIPPNAAVEFTEQSQNSIVRSAWDAVCESLVGLGDSPARAALVFDCAGRKRALINLGGSLEREVQTLASSFGESVPPLAGLYTHGEVGRVRGAKGDRNHALVVVAFA